MIVSSRFARRSTADPHRQADERERDREVQAGHEPQQVRER
jgi:hypothetical protein